MQFSWLVPATLVVALAGAPAWAQTCGKDLQRTHTVLRNSKASPDDIAQAWQHIDAARQAQSKKQFAACRSDVKAALALLQQTATKT